MKVRKGYIMNIKRLFKTSVITAALILAVFLFASLTGCLSSELPVLTEAPETGSNIIQNTISVTGQGDVKVVPDEGFIDVAVMVEKTTTQDAVNENSRITKQVTDAIEKIEASNLKLQTISYDLSPLYDYSQENQPPKIYAYRATTIIQARTTDLEKLGEIISTATETGASSISSIGFDLTEIAKINAKNDALAKAARDAETKAKAIADAMGLKVEKVLFISEGSTSYPGPVLAAATESKGADQVMSPIVFPQEIEVNSSISVTYYFSK